MERRGVQQVDRVIGLIIGASVVLISAVVVTTMFTGKIGDFGNSIDNQKKTNCQFQFNNQEEGQVSPECQGSEYDQQAMRSDEEVQSCVESGECEG